MAAQNCNFSFRGSDTCRQNTNTCKVLKGRGWDGTLQHFQSKGRKASGFEASLVCKAKPCLKKAKLKPHGRPSLV
ncbi:mCG1036112 [Mus musculus]|nr:mCG1036112 [Mus musculus]